MDPSAIEARERLGELASRAEEDLDLAEGALLLSREEYPGLDIGHYLASLDAMADTLLHRLSSCADPASLARSLNAFLYDEKGFTGNHQSYYDPRNSFLNEVLDRRLGIPITLATVYMEVARRIGLELEGIGLPGHFLLRHTGKGAHFYIDAFAGGAFLTADDCREKIAEIFNDSVSFKEEFLEPVTKLQILKRMLHNLKAIYIHREDFKKALSVCDRILVIDPEATWELRDRGLLYFRLECFRSALRDLSLYIDLRPGAEDAQAVKGRIQQLTHLVKMIN